MILVGMFGFSVLLIGWSVGRSVAWSDGMGWDGMGWGHSHRVYGSFSFFPPSFSNRVSQSCSTLCIIVLNKVYGVGHPLPGFWLHIFRFQMIHEGAALPVCPGMAFAIMILAGPLATEMRHES